MKGWRLRQWSWSVGVSLMFVLILLFFYYTTIQRPLWDQRKQAIRDSIEQTPLVHAESAELSHSELGHMIVYGVDENDEKLIVWTLADMTESDDIEHVEQISYRYISEGVTEEQIESIWTHEHPEARLIRITPSWYDDMHAWEVFYEQTVQDGTRAYYDYYRFDDGQLLTTYTLTYTD